MGASTPADDQWTAGDAYERYMGRWSRPIAELFIEWLRGGTGGQAPYAGAGGHWLEIGCGTGALTETILRPADLASLVACDLSESFLDHARGRISDPRVSFVLARANDPPRRGEGFDAVVSGLVLNFVPEPEKAVAAMRDRLRPGGCVAAYVWDYAEGMEFLRVFWDEVIALDPAAAGLDEGRRFPLCRPEAPAALFRSAGLGRVETRALEHVVEFTDFEDYWDPFLAGTGPAPAYVSSLDEDRRERLRERLRRRLRPGGDRRIRLLARAWGVRGVSLGRTAER